jgi:hypothetical protein
VLLLVSGSWPGAGHCEPPELPPAPEPVVVTTLPHPVLPPVPEPVDPTAHSPACPPCNDCGPPACAPYEDCNGPLLIGDPLLDHRNCAPPPGWFTSAEVDVVAPHVKNRLVAPVNLAGAQIDNIHLPTATLHWAGEPQFDLGYRFAEGFGEFLLTYRWLASSGSATISNFDLLGDGYLKSRLDVNVLDLDYASREFSLGPCWDMKWKVGVRLGNVFFDSHVGGNLIDWRTSNHFVGVGPNAGLELARVIPGTTVAVFGRLEAAGLWGHISQSFGESVVLEGTPILGGATHNSGTQAVLMGRLEAGVSWVPGFSEDRHFRFQTGYVIEQWWDVGQLQDSRAELTTQGVFLRFEWNY